MEEDDEMLGGQHPDGDGEESDGHKKKKKKDKKEKKDKKGKKEKKDKKHKKEKKSKKEKKLDKLGYGEDKPQHGLAAVAGAFDGFSDDDDDLPDLTAEPPQPAKRGREPAGLWRQAAGGDAGSDDGAPPVRLRRGAAAPRRAGAVVRQPAQQLDAADKAQLDKDRAREREMKKRQEEKAKKKERAIMRGGIFFQMRKDAANREREVRQQRMAQLRGQNQEASACHIQAAEVLGERQDRLKHKVKRFYQSRKFPDQCIGEVTALMPSYNIGYISLLGQDDVLPADIRRDESFLGHSKYARRLIFDGSCLLHQSIRLGDIVRFDYARLYQGIDVTSEDKLKFRRDKFTDDTRWQATQISVMNDEAIPDKMKLIPSEVRKHMLSLMTLMNSGKDLALFSKIIQEIELWKRILMERYNPKKSQEGLMRWHILLIVALSSRPWLERSHMHVFLWSFFNSFTDTYFLKETLPTVLREHDNGSKPLPNGVLLQIARFLVLYRQHTGKLGKMSESGAPADPLTSRVVRVLQRSMKRIDGSEDVLLAALHKKFEKCVEQLCTGADAENYVDLLLDSAKRGMNYTKAPSRKEMMDFDEEKVMMEAGLPPTEPEYKMLLSLDDIADEDALDPKRLPKNKVEGAWESPAIYARAQYDLLRADAFKEFHGSMYQKVFHWDAYINSQDDKHKRDVGRPTKMFRLVDVLGVSFLRQSSAGRLTYVLRFKQYEPVEERYMMQILEKGNLIGLTTDRYKTKVWWASISHRDQQLLSQGIVGVEFLKGDPIALQNELQELQLRGEDKECYLIEAQTLFFHGYKFVLDALSEFGMKAQEKKDCPFADFLVWGRSNPKAPNWVGHNQEIFAKEIDTCVEENTFDPSQERALRGLGNNFLLVQGPPGTGKSYTGVKMVDVILRTRYAVRDKMLKKTDMGKIAGKMKEARLEILRYAQLQEQVEQMKQQVLKVKLEELPKAETSEARTNLKKKMIDILQDREGVKQQMLASDMKQNECFSAVMELNHERETVLMQWQEDSGPVQVITYKNHSLDEFMMDVKPSLEDCASDPTKKEGLVRFGSRSQCDELAKYNIKEHVREFKTDPHIIAYNKMLGNSLGRKIDELKNLGAELSNLNALNMTKECMECNMTEVQARRFGEVTESSITRWRGQKQNPAMVSLQDAARAAKDQEEARGDSDSDSDSSAAREKQREIKARRDLYQSKEEQEQEDKARERFIDAFSPVLPDIADPPHVTPSFDPSVIEDLDELSMEDRQQLANVWIQNHRRSVLQQYGRCKVDYIYILACIEELMTQVKVDAVQNAQVIGLTTTGVTINKEILDRVRPSVLVIEEAAEILESQILSCLNAPSIQQVVLIGDHKQLRPIVANYDIAKECSLDLSLFERMANNNIPVHNLTNQRRMVPQISQFVRPLYRQLVDDDCLKPRKMVCELTGEIRDPGNIPGLGRPVFFWNHTSPEEPSALGLSVVNLVEVRMAVWLVRFFHARGIGLKQMTVLTPYKGQLRELREALDLAGVNYTGMVCTVDRFQGDENDIMIISLVRNERLTEFIKAPDRMCVLLSRARFGMVVMGSGTLLDDPDVHMAHWQKSMETFHSNRWISSKFPCHCDRHPNVSNGLDVADLLHAERAEAKLNFYCTEVCRAKFKFCQDQKNHRCKLPCHRGSHEMCAQPCGKLLQCGHRCKMTCGDCVLRDHQCTELTPRMNLLCGNFEWDERKEQLDPSQPFVFVNHTQRKIGCNSAFRPCQLYVWRPRPGRGRPPYERRGEKPPCGHFIRVRCSDDLEEACKREPCLECRRQEPPLAGVDRFAEMRVGSLGFCLGSAPQEEWFNIKEIAGGSRPRMSMSQPPLSKFEPDEHGAGVDMDMVNMLPDAVKDEHDDAFDLGDALDLEDAEFGAGAADGLAAPELPPGLLKTEPGAAAEVTIVGTSGGVKAEPGAGISSALVAGVKREPGAGAAKAEAAEGLSSGLGGSVKREASGAFGGAKLEGAALQFLSGLSVSASTRGRAIPAVKLEAQSAAAQLTPETAKFGVEVVAHGLTGGLAYLNGWRGCVAGPPQPNGDIDVILSNVGPGEQAGTDQQAHAVNIANLRLETVQDTDVVDVDEYDDMGVRHTDTPQPGRGSTNPFADLASGRRESSALPSLALKGEAVSTLPKGEAASSLPKGAAAAATVTSGVAASTLKGEVGSSVLGFASSAAASTLKGEAASAAPGFAASTKGETMSGAPTGVGGAKGETASGAPTGPSSIGGVKAESSGGAPYGGSMMAPPPKRPRAGDAAAAFAMPKEEEGDDLSPPTP